MKEIILIIEEFCIDNCIVILACTNALALLLAVICLVRTSKKKHTKRNSDESEEMLLNLNIKKAEVNIAQVSREFENKLISESAQPAEEQPEPESLVDLPALQTEYPDIKGWISIPGTCVDYPVLQSSADDPEYYLRRTYKGEWRTAGSIFFQWDCSAESQNTVVYGHNMNDGTMFAVLQKMADEAFRKEHSKILLQTSDGLREYQIAAVLKTDITKLPFNRTEFADHADFLSFQKELFAQSLYESQTIPGEDCRLLTLVTCSYEWENARTVVIAAEVR